jgi:hypothetical protein
LPWHLQVSYKNVASYNLGVAVAGNGASGQASARLGPLAPLHERAGLIKAHILQALSNHSGLEVLVEPQFFSQMTQVPGSADACRFFVKVSIVSPLGTTNIAEYILHPADPAGYYRFTCSYQPGISKRCHVHNMGQLAKDISDAHAAYQQLMAAGLGPVER